MNHRKVERVTYQNGIQDFQDFGLSEFKSAAVMSRKKFSSDVDSQNSVAPKPLSRQCSVIWVTDRKLGELQSYSSFQYLLSEVIILGLVMFFMVCFRTLKLQIWEKIF
jgi:hypothetical protein